MITVSTDQLIKLAKLNNREFYRALRGEEDMAEPCENMITAIDTFHQPLLLALAEQVTDPKQKNFFLVGFMGYMINLSSLSREGDERYRGLHLKLMILCIIAFSPLITVNMTKKSIINLDDKYLDFLYCILSNREISLVREKVLAALVKEKLSKKD